MQKKIIALAIAGLSSVAFAQSNVTISGQFRLGIDSVAAGGATAAGANLTSRTRVTDENSTLRFAGEEKLGNGMTAWFQVESAIGTSDNVGTSGAQTTAAANSATIGTRNTAVGLKGNWGNFFVGKWDMHYSSHAGVDAQGLAAHSGALTANSLSILHNNNGANGAGGRANNAIMYTSPNWGGFDINLGYSTAMANEITDRRYRQGKQRLDQPALHQRPDPRVLFAPEA
jgi:predicted porin